MKYKKKIKTPLLILLSLSFFLAAGFVIKEVGMDYASEALNRKVKEYIPEGYSLQYGKLSLNLWEKRVKVKNLLFYPDSLPAQDTTDRIVHFHIPLVDIRLTSIRSIFFEKKLLIQGVKVNDPEFFIRDLSTPARADISGTSVSLFSVITRYLDFFEVGKLAIDGAQLQYDLGEDRFRESLELENIDFILHKFSIDSTLLKHRFLNSESVELIINNQLLQLPDGIHQLAFEKFRLSTRDSVLSFQNISLIPSRTPLGAKTPSSSAKALYAVHIPSLKLLGVDYSTGYLKKELNIREVLLEDADIQVTEKNSPTQLKTTSKEVGQETDPLYHLLSRLAPAIHISHISLNNAFVRLDIGRLAGLDSEWQISTFDLFDFSLRAEDGLLRDGRLPFRSFRGIIRKLNQKWPDGRHRIHAEQLAFDSEKGNLSVTNLEVLPPNEEKTDNHLLLQQSVPYLEITGINYLEFLQGRPLRSRSIFLKNPVTNLILKKKDSLSRLPLLDRLREAMKKFFAQSWNTRQLLIEKGSLSLNDNLTIGQYSIKTGPVLMSPFVASWSQMVPDFKLDLNQLTFRDSLQLVQTTSFSTNGSDHVFKQLDLHWETPQIKLKARLPGLQIFRTNLDSLMAGSFCADSMEIDRAQVSIQVKEQKESQTTSFSLPLPFQSEMIALHQTSFSVAWPDSSRLDVSRFEALFRVDNWFHWFHFSLDSLQFLPANYNHRIFLGQLKKVPERERYLLNDLKLSPLSRPINWKQDLSIPRIILDGLDRDRLFTRGEFAFRKMEIFRMALDIQQETRTEDNSFSGLATDDFLSVYSDTFQVQEAKLRFYSLKSPNPLLVNIPSCNLNVLNFKWEDPKLFLTYLARPGREFSLYLKNGFDLEMPDFSLSSGALQAEGAEGKWTLKKLVFHAGQGLISHNNSIDSLSLNKFSLETLLHQKKLQVGSIALDGLKFGKLDWPASDDSLSSFQPVFSLPVRAVDIEQLEFRNMSIPGLGKIHPAPLKDIRGYFSGIRTDSLIDLRKLHTVYAEARLEVGSIQRKVGRWEEYVLSYSLCFHSGRDLLAIFNLRLEPEVSLFEYSQLMDYRSDYWNIHADSLLIRGFRPGMVFLPELSIPEVNIRNVILRIIRDERLPLRDLRKELLQGQVKSAPLPFRIGRLTFSGDVSFTALPQQSSRPAFIYINDVRASLENVTNQARYFDQDMKLKGQGKLYGEALVRLQADFDMQDSLNAFELSGNIEEMNLRRLNRIITPLSRIRIQEGRARSIAFDVSANDEYAIGEMLFKYNNLKLRLVNKKDISQVNLGNTLLSFWTNQVVKSNNPSFLKSRKGIIYFERDPQKETLNFWVHSLLSGMVSSVGVENNKRKLKRMGLEELEALNYEELFGDLLGKKKNGEKSNKKLPKFK